LKHQLRPDDLKKGGKPSPHRGEGFFIFEGIENGRQRRSRHFAVLTYSMYAPRVKIAPALLDEPF